MIPRDYFRPATRQTFSVLLPAADRLLVSIEQLRSAAGLQAGDTSRDVELTLLGEGISTDIAVTCKVAGDGINPPSLRQETVTETFWQPDRSDEIFLSRRFVSMMTTVIDCSLPLAADDYVVDREPGLLRRVRGGWPWRWYPGIVSVTYIAGFAAVPPDLQLAAYELAKLRLSVGARDPLLKRERIEVPDVETRQHDYWVGGLPGSVAGPVPDDILSRLTRFMNVALA